MTMGVMGVNLPTLSQRLLTMRSPLFRAVLATICLVVLYMAFSRFSPPEVQRPRFFATTAVRPASPPTEHQRQQTVLDEDNPGTKAADGARVEAGRPSNSFEMICDVDTNRLLRIRDQYGLDDKLEYLKRYVRFTRRDGLERKRLTHVPQKLLPDKFQTIEVGARYALENCTEPLEVDVPNSGLPSTVNASDLMFGVSTTYDRFKDPVTSPINEWVMWLTDGDGHTNGGKLLLMLLDASEEQMHEVADRLGALGIDVDVYRSEGTLPMAVRYFNLVPTLFDHPDARSKKWLVTCDDDTFFPSMHGLVDRLGQMDHNTEKYVGALSEDVGAIKRHGSQAFGGAGVFLSVPMAERISNLYTSCTADHKVHESDSGWGPQGDILLRKCIYENSDIRLTNLPELWQLDIYGHPSGFYESGIKPLSLHHYRGGGWHFAKPAEFTKLAQTCGEDCTMMRFQTADDFIISGYSIAHYPRGIDFDTDQAEATFRAAPDNWGWNLDFVLGPQRPSLLRTGRKIAWELQESEVLPDGAVMQTYTRKKDDVRWVRGNGKPMSKIDGVIELVWLPSNATG